jgi:deazaflavin-dependent oxidoreductase (nitroreductase family)
MAGEITFKPNAFQKFLHRFVMIRSVTAFFAPRIHRLDRALLERTNGKHSLAEILGWPIIELTTLGAKTHQRRSLPLIGVVDGKKIALIASSFGREHNPGWYYNLKAHPECDVLFNGRSGKYIASEIVNEDEYHHYWQLAVSYYAGYEKYKERAAPRHIPVMLLEPKS